MLSRFKKQGKTIQEKKDNQHKQGYKIKDQTKKKTKEEKKNSSMGGETLQRENVQRAIRDYFKIVRSSFVKRRKLAGENQGKQIQQFSAKQWGNIRKYITEQKKKRDKFFFLMKEGKGSGGTFGPIQFLSCETPDEFPPEVDGQS